ncbi:MAG: hypothetical protein GY820_38420 [Gammaproteobacteria bacterium]|nr:hypothetical protein [Gammaproteobacteria bacterium]
MKIPTVKIEGGESGIIINESDFDPKKHKLHKEPAKKKAPVKRKPAAKKK